MWYSLIQLYPWWVSSTAHCIARDLLVVAWLLQLSCVLCIVILNFTFKKQQLYSMYIFHDRLHPLHVYQVLLSLFFIRIVELSTLYLTDWFIQ